MDNTEQSNEHNGAGINPDNNKQNTPAQQHRYDEANVGNTRQSDAENKKGHSPETGSRPDSQDQGGYATVGNIGGGNKDWESYGSSDNDMGGNSGDGTGTGTNPGTTNTNP